MVSWLTLSSDIGITLIRVVVGAIMIRHGAAKVMAGVSTWRWLGQQMQVFGIHFFPVFWGLCCVAAELVGGAALLVGFGTHFAAFFLTCNMLVAVLMHLTKGDAVEVVEFPVLLFTCAIAFMLIGGGALSFDALIWH
jgi:putative oxidoreductase